MLRTLLFWSRFSNAVKRLRGKNKISWSRKGKEKKRKEKKRNAHKSHRNRTKIAPKSYQIGQSAPNWIKRNQNRTKLDKAHHNSIEIATRNLF